MLNKKTHQQLLLSINNKTQVNSLLNVPMLFLYNHMNKEGYFYSHENIWHTTISKIVDPSLSKDMKGLMQIKRGKCYSLMLLYLKISYINVRTK